jgi:hypothetical protein
MHVYMQNLGTSAKYCCCGKAIIITYSECVLVSSLIQLEKRVGRIVLSYVACPAVPYVSPLSLKQMPSESRRVRTCSSRSATR